MKKKIVVLGMILMLSFPAISPAEYDAAEAMSKNQFTRALYHVASAPTEIPRFLAAEPVGQRSAESWTFGLLEALSRTAVKLFAGAFEMIAWTTESFTRLDNLT